MGMLRFDRLKCEMKSYELNECNGMMVAVVMNVFEV